MITIYEFNGTIYRPSVIIDEENGIVSGSSQLAKYFEDGFQHLRDEGYQPENHMDKIKNRLENNWRNAYHWADW
jgi:hypothetical protein